MAITYQTARAEYANGSGAFFAQGGAVELKSAFYRNFAVVASFTGQHAGAASSGGAPLSFVTIVFGPRYSFTPSRPISAFVEGLAGEADAFEGAFPGPSGATVNPANGLRSDAVSLAILAGGGVDLRLKRHLALRLVQADWLRTQFPNGAAHVQNNLRLGSGLVFRFGS